MGIQGIFNIQLTFGLFALHQQGMHCLRRML